MMESEKYDAIIVGGGPAGSMAALELAKAGKQVLMIDKKKELGVPVRCGEGLGIHWVEELGLKISDRAVSCNVNGAYLFSPSLKKLSIKNSESKGYVLDRKVFDRELAMNAARKGAELMIKTEVLGIGEYKNGTRKVKVEHMGEEKNLEANVVIACDGGESTAARMAGIESFSNLYDTDFGVEYEMVNVDVEDAIEIYFTNKYAPRGYVWIFPKGKDVANVGVGIGGHVKGPALRYLEMWMKDERIRGRLKRAQITAVKAGMIPVCEPLKKMVLDGFMVAGTAAHQVDPIHGGGIGLAMEAGMIAGKTAADCIENGSCLEKDLEKYVRDWKAKRGRRFKKRVALRKALEAMNDEDLDFIFGVLENKDLDKVIAEDYLDAVKKVITGRPSLLKVLKPLVEGML